MEACNSETTLELSHVAPHHNVAKIEINVHCSTRCTILLIVMGGFYYENSHNLQQNLDKFKDIIRAKETPDIFLKRKIRISRKNIHFCLLIVLRVQFKIWQLLFYILDVCFMWRSIRNFKWLSSWLKLIEGKHDPHSVHPLLYNIKIYWNSWNISRWLKRSIKFTLRGRVVSADRG